MFSKNILSLALAGALAVGPVTRVAAGSGDALLGGIVGGVIGGVIVNEANKNKPRTTTRTVVVRPVDTATRAANRETQTALNYFGYAAGSPDGVMGRRSISAIASYQAFMNYPADGNLTPFQRDILVGAYNRGIIGAYETAQMVNTSPLGPKALLLAQRDALMGVSPATTVAAPITVPAQTVTPVEIVATPAPITGLTTLPVLAATPSQGSLSNHCSKVSLMTNANGGFTTVSAMTDPVLVLNEQFCLARAYALDDGERLVAGLQGVTQAQVDAQCAAYGPALKDYVASLSRQSRNDVVSDVSGFVTQSGIDPAQLGTTAKACLSVGYRTDDMDVAIGSGLLLVALGEDAYGELMGHHLSQGFGVGKREELAMEWYDQAIQAIDYGAPQVFAPNQVDRIDLINAAVLEMRGGDQSTPTPISTKGGSSLPTFNSKN